MALKQLLEAQNSLATMTSQQGQSTTLESVEVSVQVESTEKVTKTVKPKSAKAAAAKEAALNNIKDVKPYQVNINISLEYRKETQLNSVTVIVLFIQHIA